MQWVRRCDTCRGCLQSVRLTHLFMYSPLFKNDQTSSGSDISRQNVSLLIKTYARSAGVPVDRVRFEVTSLSPSFAPRLTCEEARALGSQRCASMAKGVSAAEKKERMLKLFRESKDVFTKKEIESRSTKVGIISNAVEGVLKELVGDDLVREEKVGISTYWWSFPGEDAAKKRRELSEQQAAVAELKPKLEQLQQQQAAVAMSTGGEGDASELQALEASIDALRGRQKAASEELTKLTKHGA